jgi:hypothetical protein
MHREPSYALRGLRLRHRSRLDAEDLGRGVIAYPGHSSTAINPAMSPPFFRPNFDRHQRHGEAKATSMGDRENA